MMEQIYSSETQELLREIDDIKQQIDDLRPLTLEQENYILQKFRLDWNYHSNAIEGNALNYGETYAFILHGLTAKGKPFKDYLDIRGHNDAINCILNIVRSKDRLTETDIRNLHAILLVEPYDSDAMTKEGNKVKKRISIGSYKILPNSVLTSTKEIHYYASPEDTPILMGELMDWYNQNIAENPRNHPIINAAIFHHRFVSIHPFDDGNGRMARLLMNLILLRYKFPPVVIKLETKNEYYLALSQADAGNIEPFIQFVANSALASLELFKRGALGESIEEPSDLDKSLALFKQEVEAEADKIELIRSLETQKKIYQESILPLFNEISLTVNKFKEYFIDFNEISIQYVEQKNRLKSWAYFIKDIEQQLNSFFTQEQDSFCCVCFLYEDFKVKNNMFGLEVKFFILLSRVYYEIYIGVSENREINGVYEPRFQFWLPKLIIKKPYHQLITKDEISRIANKIGFDMLNLMKSKKDKSYKSLNEMLDDKIHDIWEEFTKTYPEQTNNLLLSSVNIIDNKVSITFKGLEVIKKKDAMELYFSRFIKGKLNIDRAVFVNILDESLPF